jgi:hypothetical protein
MSDPREVLSYGQIEMEYGREGLEAVLRYPQRVRQRHLVERVIAEDAERRLGEAPEIFQMGVLERGFHDGALNQLNYPRPLKKLPNKAPRR